MSGRLPADARPALGPDATGVGWIYEYALADRSGKHDLAQLRSLQDWFLKFELRSVPGVAEVATLGGMVKQYQVVANPDRLRAYNISLSSLRSAIERASQESGGAVIEMAEAEYLIRAKGYVSGIKDLRAVPLGKAQNGTPVLLEDVAEVRLGPQLRQGIAELNGEGEVVGGIVVMRSGKNAQQVIAGVKAKLAALKTQLPAGVEIIETYDRSSLIQRAVSTLQQKLAEEFIVVVLVCLVFLFHLRSSLVVVISLPLAILAAYVIMYYQGINANIMSLGGIAIAVGAMVDAAIVMIENAHKHLERETVTDEAQRRAVIKKAATEVGPPLFFALLIITLSFLPVFTLQGQEGRLFAPLAYTKTYAMAAAAALSRKRVQVLIGYCIRGKIAN
jgi:Cu(I)/Ag(I) efflux system membrane protein CusA/SilA